MYGSECALPILPERVSLQSLEAYIDKEVVVGIRPEHLHVEQEYMVLPTSGVIEADVDLVELMGSETYLYVTCGEEKLIAKTISRDKVTDGERIKLAIDCNKLHIFDKDTQGVIV